MQKHRDIQPNERFGRLVVIGLFPHKGCYNTYYKCICDCGVECFVARAKLLTKQKSCSCLSSTGKSINRKDLSVEEAAFNSIYTRYEQQARSRNLKWLLNKEQAFTLFKANCFYCGRQPSNSQITKATPTRKSEIVKYNGIDRLTNTNDYDELNCVPCCGECNRMKMTNNLSEFINNIKLIYENISIQNINIL